MPFAAVPQHFIEISSVLLDSAQEDIPNALQIRRVVDELRDARQNKIARGLNGLKDITLLQVLQNIMIYFKYLRPTT